MAVRPIRQSLADLVQWLKTTGLLPCHVRESGS